MFSELQLEIGSEGSVINNQTDSPSANDSRTSQEKWVSIWLAATEHGAALRDWMAEGFGDELACALIEEVAVMAVREMADSFIAHTQPYVRVDPFVKILSELADGVIPAMCQRVAREAVTEIANAILLNKRCEIALRGVEEEFISDLLHTSNLFEVALEQEDEAQAVGCLLEEAVATLARAEAAAALHTFESDARQTHGDYQRLAVDGVVRRVVSTRVAVGHLMMSISNRFGATLLEHHIRGVALRLALERSLMYLSAVEERIETVSESDVCEHAFAEAVLPGVQDELVRLLLLVSRDMEDRIDEMEEARGANLS